VIWNAPFRQ